MNMRNCVALAAAALLLPACRSHKSAETCADSTAKSVSVGLAVGACAAVESVVIDEWYFYPDSIVPLNVTNDSTIMQKTNVGALARKRVVQVRRNTVLAMAKDSVAKEAAISRSSSLQTGNHEMCGTTVWLRLALMVLAAVLIVAIARARDVI